MEDKIPIVCEYHILYNPSYSCPDVFFNMWYTGNLLNIYKIKIGKKYLNLLNFIFRWKATFIRTCVVFSAFFFETKCSP